MILNLRQKLTCGQIGKKLSYRRETARHMRMST